MRDFPTLADPEKPSSLVEQVPVPTRIVEPAAPAETLFVAAEQPLPRELDSAYRLGVGDELSLFVVGQPDLNRPLKVLPDGSITAPGAGTVYVMGHTIDETSARVEEQLGNFLRYPQVDVVINEYGEHVVYVMGEVESPNDHIYRKGMTALQAVAAAGGFKQSGKKSDVIIFRRVDADAAEFITVNLDDPLHGQDLQNDIMLRPYDIVYVPKTFIGNVNSFVDQWFRQNLSAFSFYIEGWYAYNLTRDRVIIRNP